jgi:signal peptidase II
MKITLRATVVVLTVLGSVGCDQVTKSVARHYLRSPTPLSLFGGVVRLQHAENPGAFLSLGDSLPWRTRLAVFTLGGAALVIGAGFWAFRSRRPSSIQIVGAALVRGGGLSNLIDRLRQDGNVTDFCNSSSAWAGFTTTPSPPPVSRFCTSPSDRLLSATSRHSAKRRTLPDSRRFCLPDGGNCHLGQETTLSNLDGHCSLLADDENQRGESAEHEVRRTDLDHVHVKRAAHGMTGLGHSSGASGGGVARRRMARPESKPLR